MPSGPPPPSEQGQALARGATIGRYVVLGLVGRGGMGEVYAAYDPELDRKVAVKLLRVKPGAGVSLAEGRQRTLREAQAIARLSHPNVVVVYDVGTFRDQVFIAMEFVEGNTVTYWVESQVRSWQEILKVFIAAGKGLLAAHEKGLVHRDFKPDNVMVGRDHQVRVMDFGLARQMNERRAPGAERGAPAPAALTVDRPAPPGPGAPAARDAGTPVIGPPAGAYDGSSEGAQPESTVSSSRVPIPIIETGREPHLDPMSTVVLNAAAGPATSSELPASSAMFEAQLTRTGAMMGTPAYMAPEQFLGTPTDARTDQFSFCIALYEGLYGERPFPGNTMFALTSNVVQGKVREASAASKVPFWLRKILLRGLRPQANDRYPSMEELLEALSKNPNALRRKWAVTAAVAVLPVALVLISRQIVASHEPPCSSAPAKLAGIWDLQAPGEPESPRRAAIHKAFLSTGKGYAADVYATVSRSLTTYAQSWTKMHKEACEATEVHKEQSAEVLDLRISCLQERLGGLKALTEVFREGGAEAVENAVSASNALASLDRCADVPLLRAVVRPPEDPATRARVAELRTRVADLKARLDAGHVRDAARAGTPLVAEARALGYQPLISETLAILGSSLIKSNDSHTAEEFLLEAFWAADASRHDEVRAEVAANLVYLVGYQEGNFEASLRWLRTAEAVLRRLGGHELLQSWLLNDIGSVYYLHGKKEDSLRVNQEAVNLKEHALGRDHPDVGVSEGNLAIALSGAGRNQEALMHVDRAVLLLENGLGAAHPDLAIQLNNRGEILSELGRYPEARQSFERARVIWERELGTESPNLAYALTGIGLSYLAEQQSASALVPLERAFKLRESHEKDFSRRAETRFALARALWDSNRDRARARALAEQAKDAYERSKAKDKVHAIEEWLRRHGST